jgi:phthalate 4,5-cis-dihydrodiol dehydrogenase
MIVAASGKLGVGIVGLGGAAVGMIPGFNRNPHYDIVAAADLDQTILDRFAQDFDGSKTYTDIAQLCADPKVDFVYIGTPNHVHSAHARIALEHGKHVLTEKPMAVSLEEAGEMIATGERHNALLGVNVKHSFEPRIQKIREFVRSGQLGALRMLHSWRYVDWLYRPRSREELSAGWGNGILWRQGPHQFDIIRTIGGGKLRSVRGMTGTWDPARRVPGSFTVYFEFEDGVAGTAICNSYNHLDSRAFVYGFDGKAPLTDTKNYAKARRELMSHADDPDWEHGAATSERYGGGRQSTAASKMPGQSGGWILGGPLVASFDRGDVRLSPAGLVVDGDDKQWEITFAKGRNGVDNRLDSFYESITQGRPLPADGGWGRATQEVLVAIERSAETRTEIMLEQQTTSVD